MKIWMISIVLGGALLLSGVRAEAVLFETLETTDKFAAGDTSGGTYAKDNVLSVGFYDDFERAAVVCDPGDYENVLWHLAKEGRVPDAARFDLALKAFAHTAAYDAAIARALPGYDLVSGNKRGESR